MWANEEVVALTEWLREHNAPLEPAQRVGFYGLDVYGLSSSLRALLDYLREHEPEHLDAAVRATRCFEPFATTPGVRVREPLRALVVRAGRRRAADPAVHRAGGARRRRRPRGSLLS